MTLLPDTHCVHSPAVWPTATDPDCPYAPSPDPSTTITSPPGSITFDVPITDSTPASADTISVTDPDTTPDVTDTCLVRDTHCAGKHITAVSDTQAVLRHPVPPIRAASVSELLLSPLPATVILACFNPPVLARPSTLIFPASTLTPSVRLPPLLLIVTDTRLEDPP